MSPLVALIHLLRKRNLKTRNHSIKHILIDAAEKVYAAQSRKSPATTWLRRKSG